MALAAAITALEALFGTRFTQTRPEREAHGHSEAWFPLTPPDAVVYPETTEEVAALMKICAAEGVPVTGWGAGTSLEGHALPLKGGITVDFTRMNRIVDLSAEDRLVRIQPGLTREELNTELRATGLFFPVDPGANATLGGMASTRASGTTTVRYGTMRDNVAALEVVLADGRVIRTGSGAAKSASGYDLTALFLGAEGTLGLITELTLRLHGQPEAISSAVCAFDTLEAAVETVQTTIQMGIPMARIEFVDEEVARIFNAINGTHLPEKPHLMIEFHGSDATVAEDSRRFGEVVADMGGADFQWATTTEDRNRLWKMRHEAYLACLASRPGSMGLITDVCVPISRLPEAVERGREMIAKAGLVGPILGHVGDGNFHAILLLRRDDAAELAKAKEVAHDLAHMALEMGGTITGEHGIGAGKRGLMAAEHDAAWQVMGQIKAALDPQGLLNPGKIVPGPEDAA
ncbi:FAD-binding protein [Sinirhodobacter ferrireducens]|uniref:D-lactate dehydrogenase (cytochrome) n=1 Tax=Paenirhodobacter ferrireducens TaxID=1215032 RepID=A0A443LBG5_9RHOB|nr:FAD-linked oxidase C-terminal domain-containing protein [Sinirhodobacter ferrireducens]RWR46502.1 FAD-binding protein [Sinirhodobacter ferrireducens]